MQKFFYYLKYVIHYFQKYIIIRSASLNVNIFILKSKLIFRRWFLISRINLGIVKNYFTFGIRLIYHFMFTANHRLILFRMITLSTLKFNWIFRRIVSIFTLILKIIRFQLNLILEILNQWTFYFRLRILNFLWRVYWLLLYGILQTLFWWYWLFIWVIYL